MNRYPKIKADGPDGISLTAQIAGYSWGMPRLVIDVGEWQELGFPVVSERVTLDLDPKTLRTDDDVHAALALAIEVGQKLPTVACVTCGTRRLDVKDTNRKTKDGRPLCEPCFMAVLEAEWAKEEEKARKRAARMDAKRRKEGFTHKVLAWIHPRAGGDDYQVEAYTVGTPNEATLRKIMRGSVRFDDYQIVDLNAGAPS